MAEPSTVLHALIPCGVDNVILFMDEIQAQRVAAYIFDNMFMSCMDLAFKVMDAHFITYLDLTVVAQGQIRLRPGRDKNIKAFVQWTRDEMRLGRDSLPYTLPGRTGQQSYY
jgi:hypothetical protein